MAFTVGQKVVRVGHKLCASADYLSRIGKDYTSPKLGEICTIASIADWFGQSILRLAEHDNSHLTPLFPIEPGFHAECFRPIVERKTEISFTIGADPESEKWDNRKPVPAYSFDVTEHESILQYLRGFY